MQWEPKRRQKRRTLRASSAKAVAICLFIYIQLNTHCSARTTEDGTGQGCWEEAEDFAATARCLQETMRERAPGSEAEAASLMHNVARAASTLDGAGAREQHLAAVELLDVALDQQPANSNLHFLRGNALGALGQHQSSADAYASAVAYLPLHVDALHNFAAVLMDLPAPLVSKQRHAVVRALQTALRILPNSPRLHLSCGLVLSELGRSKAATRLLRRSHALDPSSVLVAAELALSLEASGLVDEAERTLTDARSLTTSKETQSEALRRLGDFLLRRGRHLDACEAFDESLTLSPHSAHGHSGKGACLRDQGLFQLAVLSYQDAANTERNAQSLTNLGSVLVEAGRFEQVRAGLV